MKITERTATWRRERRVLLRVSRAAWRLEEAERERSWALASARAEGVSIRALAAAVRLSSSRIAVTATRRLRRPHPGGGMPALRRAVRALRYANEELLRGGSHYPLLSCTATPAAARRDRRHAYPPSFHDRTC